jgi:protein gp37
MAQKTAIEWTDVSWNPVHGCSKISPGCAHCYAAELSLRYRHTTLPWTPANAAENVLLKPHKLHEPLRKSPPWDQPRRVFVNSMSDLFHEQVPVDFIEQVLLTIDLAGAHRPGGGGHIFQVLTKRPARMRDVMTAIYEKWSRQDDLTWAPIPNLWLGVSIENRRFVERADVLRQTPAAVRFISAEPLLGPLVPMRPCTMAGPGAYVWQDRGILHERGLDLRGIDWLICGGESGPGHRQLNIDWLHDLYDAARAAGTAFFAKQDSGSRPGKRGRIPDHLWVQEFPQPRAIAA